MSYDLAVWEGKRPASDAAARAMFDALYADEERRKKKPTPAIAKYVRALLAKWPDITKDDESPWSDAPLMNNARGSLFYFGMSFSGAAEASAFAASLAKKQKLVCFDPQTKRLRPNDRDDGAKKRNANPPVKPGDAVRRLNEGLAPTMKTLGFEPSKRNRFTQVEFVRKLDDDLSLYLGWSLAAGSVKPMLSMDSPRVTEILDAYVPVRKGSRRRTMFAFARSLWDENGWLGKKGSATWFEDAVCHEKCITGSLRDIQRNVVKFAPPLVASLDSFEKLDAFYNGRGRRKYEGNWEYVIPFVSVIVASLAPNRKRFTAAVKNGRGIVKSLPSRWNDLNVYFDRGSPQAAFEKLLKKLG